MDIVDSRGEEPPPIETVYDGRIDPCPTLEEINSASA